MQKGLFVTGTDTDCGKTLVTTGLLHLLGRRGLRVAGMKPVASGALLGPEGRCSPDAQAIQAAANVPLSLGQINPYLFDPPIAPHLAAELCNKKIEFKKILDIFKVNCDSADGVVVEGVGGWRVPLGPEGDVADLARLLGLPVVLVVGMRLGCINHALLTAEAIQRDGLRLAGWVANRRDPGMAEFEGNLSTIQRRIAAPLLGVIPVLGSPDPAQVAELLDEAALGLWMKGGEDGA